MTNTSNREEPPERTPRVWVAPSSLQGRAHDDKRYHTTPTCRRVPDDCESFDRDELGSEFSKCMFCAAEATTPNGRRASLRDRVARGEIETHSTSKRWWER